MDVKLLNEMAGEDVPPSPGTYLKRSDARMWAELGDAAEDGGHTRKGVGAAAKVSAWRVPTVSSGTAGGGRRKHPVTVTGTGTGSRGTTTRHKKALHPPPLSSVGPRNLFRGGDGDDFSRKGGGEGGAGVGGGGGGSGKGGIQRELSFDAALATPSPSPPAGSSSFFPAHDEDEDDADAQTSKADPTLQPLHIDDLDVFFTQVLALQSE
jgi:hypothetical protein